MENKDWREEVKNLIDEYSGMEQNNGEYERMIPLIESLLQSKQEEIEGAMDKKMLPETEMKGGVDYMCGKAYNQALEDLKPIISNLLK